MATLVELREALFPAARPVGAEVAGGIVGWVRVLRGRTPALDVLEAGDLVIVPASALAIVAPGPPETVGLVEALARAPVSGLLLVDGEGERAGGPGPLDALAEAAAAAGLPAYRLADPETGALERSVIGFLVNRRAELDRQAAALEDRLHALALGGADPEALAAAVGGFLARAVAIEDGRAEPVAVHAPADAPGAAADAAAYLANRRATALRVALPATGGALAVLGEAPVSELGRAACERVAPFLALELGRDAVVRRARDLTRRSEALPAGGPPWVVLLARQGGDEDRDDIDRREAVRAEIRRLAPARRLVLRGDAWSVELRAVVATAPDDPAGAVVAGRVASLLGRTVAVSRPFIDPGGRPIAEAEARSTLEAALESGDPPAVALADRQAAYRLMGALHNLPDGPRQARALLAPLLAGRRATVEATLRTLRAVLEHPGPAEAAAALGVHRNTVAYRVRRIERQTGWDLRDPELRLAILVAVRLVQRAQQGEGPATSPPG
jgi:hypothetical protein